MWVEYHLCKFHLLFFIIVVALIVVVNFLSERDWYFVIPLGIIIYLSGGSSRRWWSVLCRISFVWIYPLFHCRRCCTHRFQESPFWKGWIGHNPYGHYHLLPGSRSGRGLSCLSTTFSSFCCRHCRMHGLREALFVFVMLPY